MQRGKFPYRSLGSRLNEIRKKSLETIPEVAGSVELDSEVISRFEKGEERPSEDVLMLLISHFDVRDEEADELWDLAGYNAPTTPGTDQPSLPTLVVVPHDTRIIYTDTANISVNNFGVVMSFMQNSTNNQPISLGRYGMSMEHAKSMLEVLTRTIAQAEASKNPKQLPSSTAKSPKKRP